MSHKDHFSTVLGAEDDKDKKIVNYTVGMAMGLNLGNFILTDKNKHDDYFKRLIEIGTSLQKANAHIRRYIKEEKNFLEQFRRECERSASNTNSSTTAIALTSELDGFLSQFKSSLDSLAKTFRPLFGISTGSWGKKLDTQKNKEVSGLRVINSLEKNLKDLEKAKAEDLINYLRETSDWVTALVELRDEGNHDGGVKGVTPILYDVEEKVVYPQMFRFNDGSSMLVRDFMSKRLDEGIDFVATVLILSIQVKLPGNDMFIVENQKSDFPPFLFAVKKRV